MVHCVDDPSRELFSRAALAGMDRDLDPVELGEDVVGQIEIAVWENVAFDPAEHPEGGESVVCCLDFERLAAQRIGVESGYDAHVWGVVADCEVLVAECLGGNRHFEHGSPTVRPGRVAVELAADRRGVDQVIDRRSRGELAEFGGEGTEAERAVERFLVEGVGQSQCGDIVGGSGGAEERGAESGWRRCDQFDRGAVDCQAKTGSMSAAIWRAANCPRIVSGESVATTTARWSGLAVYRRTSPAGRPPSAAAISAVSLRARLSDWRLARR